MGGHDGYPASSGNTALTTTQAPTPTLVAAYPTHQNAIDIFQDQWSTKMPAQTGLIAKPGRAALVTIRRVPRCFDLHAALGAMFCCIFQFQGSNS